MVCIRCGTPLPVKANFCFACGTPQKTEGQVLAVDPPYETCQIACSQDEANRFTHTFWAKALGLKGTYNAGESPQFMCSEDSLMRADPVPVAACKALVARLTQDGWEPITVMGDAWFAYRFRRRIA